MYVSNKCLIEQEYDHDYKNIEIVNYFELLITNSK